MFEINCERQLSISFTGYYTWTVEFTRTVKITSPIRKGYQRVT